MNIANLHTLADSSAPDSEYKVSRYSIIAQLEGKRAKPYFDSANLITIGIGFNMEPYSLRTEVFNAMGLTAAEKNVLNTAWSSPQMLQVRAMPASTNAQRDARNAALEQLLSGALGRSFEMTDSSMKTRRKWERRKGAGRKARRADRARL